MRINLSVTNGTDKVEASYVSAEQPLCACGQHASIKFHTVALKVNRKGNEFAGRYVRTVETVYGNSTASNQVVVNVPGVDVDTEFADSEAREVLAEVPGLIDNVVQNVPFDKLAPVARFLLVNSGGLVNLAAQFAAAKANASQPESKFDAEGYDAEGYDASGFDRSGVSRSGQYRSTRQRSSYGRGY